MINGFILFLEEIEKKLLKYLMYKHVHVQQCNIICAVILHITIAICLHYLLK